MKSSHRDIEDIVVKRFSGSLDSLRYQIKQEDMWPTGSVSKVGVN